MGTSSKPMHLFFAMKKLLVVILGFVLLCSCSHKVYVPVETVREVVRVEKDSVRDSVYLHDSILIRSKGDTVLVEKWHTKYIGKTRDVYLLDSIRDSIPVPYPVEKIVEVEKPLHVWQKVLMWLGAIALAVFAFVLYRKFRAI